MADDCILEVEDLEVRYGLKVALDGVSMSVRRGEVVTLLGANGAGKTTMLMTLSGFRQFTKGQVAYEGHRLAGHAPARLSRMGLIHVPEGRRVFPGMTVRENLELGAACARHGGRRPGQLDAVMERFPVLVSKLPLRAGLLSGGEQQMLVIGRALMASPRLLLLDEPSLGLAPMAIGKVFATLRALKEEGVTMLVVEQNVHYGLRLADRAYVLQGGQVVKTGTGAALLGDEEVRMAYLGGSS